MLVPDNEFLRAAKKRSFAHLDDLLVGANQRLAEIVHEKHDQNQRNHARPEYLVPDDRLSVRDGPV